MKGTFIEPAAAADIMDHPILTASTVEQISEPSGGFMKGIKRFGINPSKETAIPAIKMEARREKYVSLERFLFLNSDESEKRDVERFLRTSRLSYESPFGIFPMVDSDSRYSSSRFNRFSTVIDLASEPDYFYHSIGGMNPIKLIGILKQGILSKYEAESRGLVIDANGIQCNGTHYVSAATHFGDWTRMGQGAFHFVIERKKLATHVRKNPEQDMPTERQVYLGVPRSAIKAIQLEKEGFMDIEHPSIKLGIGQYEKRAGEQIKTYINFMMSEFGYKMPEEDIASIQKALHAMKTASSTPLSFFESRRAAEQLESNMDMIIKKHLKLCYQKLTSKELITPYDILRHYDQSIPVCDHTGKDINLLSAQVAAADEEPIASLSLG